MEGFSSSIGTISMAIIQINPEEKDPFLWCGWRNSATTPWSDSSIFPEGLLIQLLKMLHLDVEARVGEHQIFSALLIPSSDQNRHGVASLRSSFVPRRWHSSSCDEKLHEMLSKLQDQIVMVLICK